ncbi:MAG TPA: hypothetical protein DCM36_00410, partial [Xanthomonadaceae bacterium]|nr:hypothetical protein [Xanthomonadaceae bacterium]
IHESIGEYSPWSSYTGYGEAGGLTGGFASGSGGGALGYGQQALDPLTGLPVIGSSSAYTGTINSLPVGTKLESQTARVGLGYKFNDRLSAGGEVEQDVGGEERHRIAAGLDYQVFER